MKIPNIKGNCESDAARRTKLRAGPGRLGRCSGTVASHPRNEMTSRAARDACSDTSAFRWRERTGRHHRMAHPTHHIPSRTDDCPSFSTSSSALQLMRHNGSHSTKCSANTSVAPAVESRKRIVHRTSPPRTRSTKATTRPAVHALPSRAQCSSATFSMIPTDTMNVAMLNSTSPSSIAIRAAASLMAS